VRTTTAENVEQLLQLVDEMLLVSDDDLLRAISWLRKKENFVVERAGAASAAALLRWERRFTGSRIVLVVSGANITPKILRRAEQMPLDP
jgi:threonine dehydratase